MAQAQTTETTALEGEVMAEESITLRGHLYRIVELPYDKFDALQKTATRKITLPNGQTEDGEVDQDLLDKLLMNKAIAEVTPPLGEKGVLGQGTRVVIALRTVVNRLHYGAVGKTALQTELDASEAAQSAAEDKAKGKG